MKKNNKNNSKKRLIEIVKKNWKMFSIIGVVVIAIIIAIATVPPKKTAIPETPIETIEANYKGSYTKSSGEIKIIKFFDGKKVKINDCVFSNLNLTSSSSSSSFSGRFVSNNDKITGTVHIDFILYDKDKKIIKSFYNDLKDVKKGEEKIVLAEYFEEIDNVDSLSIRIQK